ncbi:MAG: phosphatidylserine decarboxylase [Caldilineaceae bacterium]|nr:phosphatidylserine decarboxylase [Caldilineaceae bacterium]
MLTPFSDSIEFFKEFVNNIQEVSAVLPTSSYAGDALAAEVARCTAPKRVLEVGAGNGAITVRIAPQIGPNDELTVCELNASFMQMLRKRFAGDQTLRSILPRTNFYEGSILDFQPTEKFDYIISTLPFNTLPPSFVEAVMQHYIDMLKPGGILSYIEYIGGRTVKAISKSDADQEQRLAVLRKYQGNRMRSDVVTRNVPPAWIHHLRFGEAPTTAARNLQPGTQTHQVEIPSFALDSDALPFIAGAATMAFLWRKLAPNSRIWLLPATLAALLAAFFRDPKRQVVADPSLIYAASDGVVLAVEELTDERFGEQPWLRVAVFLSLLDVHVNRAPVAGKVVELVQEEGGFANASHAAAEHNQALYTVIETGQGRCIVAQRVGLIARRIVNRCRPGTLLGQGDKMGLIRFGSRTDVYVPATSATALVQPGDRVIGGMTALARFRNVDAA